MVTGWKITNNTTGNVFGGGDAAKVEGNTEIRLNMGVKMNETSATELLNLIR